MDRFIEALLIVGLVFVAAYSQMISQDAIKTMADQNKKIEMMFVKS